jgi:hypothetical protein
MKKPNATIILKLGTTRGVELAQAVLDIKLLRDGTFAIWGLAEHGHVQATRWAPRSAPWQVCSTSAEKDTWICLVVETHVEMMHTFGFEDDDNEDDIACELSAFQNFPVTPTAQII